MAAIRIPENVFPGFRVIASLEENKINELVSYLNSLPVGKQYDEVADEFDGILNEKKGKELLKTILSFSELVEEDEENYKDVVNNLVSSFVDLSNDELDPAQNERLENNLLKIFHNYKSIDQNIQSRQLALENENNLKDFQMLTDIRLIFDTDLENKERIGIVIHKLNLEYTKDFEDKKFHLALDIDNLKKLKSEIEKAIERDKLVREDYKQVLKYII
ncbi:hypothetical protein [Salinimicrobium sp. WS361]|jgi:hypothetical protein|uniref:hypothetical protein n=1 Tax=Salinimicrobium sp. WS361 TaxID=3425123 RepID=UPI003D6FCF6D